MQRVEHEEAWTRLQNGTRHRHARPLEEYLRIDATRIPNADSVLADAMRCGSIPPRRSISSSVA